MAFAFLFAGILMTVAAVRGTHSDLAKLIKGDFTGPGNFLLWGVAVVIIGAIGYIPALRKISVAFLAVILLGLFLAKANPGAPGGGFFAQLQNALNKTTGPAYGGLGTGSTLHFPAAMTLPGSASTSTTTGSGSATSAFPSFTDLFDSIMNDGEAN